MLSRFINAIIVTFQHLLLNALALALVSGLSELHSRVTWSATSRFLGTNRPVFLQSENVAASHCGRTSNLSDNESEAFGLNVSSRPCLCSPVVKGFSPPTQNKDCNFPRTSSSGLPLGEADHWNGTATYSVAHQQLHSYWTVGTSCQRRVPQQL
jgi:hypothetical protein